MKGLLALALAALASALPSLYLNTTAPSTTLTWTLSPILASPANDTRHIAGLKDPSIIHLNGTYHVFASTAVSAGYSLVYFNFSSFDSAAHAPFTYLDASGIGTGYRAAPQIFWFAPQRLWYLVFQNDNAAYSTNPDIANPLGWSAVKTFYDGVPEIVARGLKDPQQGYWVDMWVVCDDETCHLFSSDDNGRLYRSETSVAAFPASMSEPVIVMQTPRKQDLFEASCVYARDDGSYLLLVECIGDGESAGGVRYFRSWTATSLRGPWTDDHVSQADPWLGEANAVWPKDVVPWTKSLSHGEIVRTSVDQRMRIGGCEGWEFLFQGVEAGAQAEYNALPWRLGVATQTGRC